MDGRATRHELVEAMSAWADALDQGEPMLPWMPLVLLDRAVELEGEEAALRVADHLAQVEELDLTVKALRLLGEHDLRPWAVEMAVRVLVGESHLPFVSPVVVMRAVEAAGLGHVGPSGPRALLLGSHAWFQPLPGALAASLLLVREGVGYEREGR